MPVVGFLHPSSPEPFGHIVDGFRRGLNDTGFVEGQNVTIEYRWARGEYDRLPALAADLVQRRVRVILAGGGEVGALAAKAATSTIPILIITSSDPVKSGLVASFNRPGGNVTGLMTATSVLEGWSQPVNATLYLEEEMECALMGDRFHRGFTAAEKTELWDRWKRGESLKAIGRAFGKPSSSIYFLVAPHGGIRPAQRRRSRLALTLAEREVISRGVTTHQSARSIAKFLSRSPSTVSREMGRNGGHDRYRAALADENAWTRARRSKCCKLANSPRLRRAVAGKLRLDWSPEQIAGWLKRTHPEDECNQVSHETIYRSLFVQTRGVLKKELLSHLRSKRSMRRSKPVDPNGDRRGHIKDIVSIRQRPAAIEDRAVPGHWEGDLLSGPNNSYIATLVERHTRYVMLAKVAGKDTQTVVSALIKQAKKLPRELYKSLTWDRGKELTDHRRFTLATKIDVYFCDPQSPWQRGSNENTNGLLRQYFPKSTDLSVHSQAYLNKVARQLNERPRETLQFETPAERFNACVASTG